MNEEDRISLVQSFARLASSDSRPTAIRELSAGLGLEGILFFVSDPATGGMISAPGFVPAPSENSWTEFFSSCGEDRTLTGKLPFPQPGDLKSVTGVAWEKKAVLALVGPPPPEDVVAEFSRLLPLLASTLGHEREKLVRAREQAAAAVSAKDDFLAALSHELRMPLNPVLIIASEAAENPALPDQVRRDFAAIAKYAELEARLIDDLLDLTRITQGKMSLDRRSLDLRAVLQDAVTTTRADLAAKKIDFVTALATGEHPVFGDSARLQQLFWNVLRNALKFTATGGQIQIRTQLDGPGQQIVVTFTGTGIGLEPAEVEKIFASFSLSTQADPAGANRSDGLDLGMAISRLLVQLHAGTIETTSEGRGKGATFTVRLPLASSSSGKFLLPNLPEAAPPAPASEARRRVLLVEDHEPTTVALARLLTRRGFDVVVAASMAEALQAAEASKLDLVISDIGLPDGNGYSLMTTLQQRHRLPGIAVSGYGMQEDIARSEAAGFIAHIIKPVSVRALESALELVRPAPPKR